jgi:hypothetical protein
MVVGVGLTGLVVGLAIGLWLFRLRSRWCPRCGDWTLPRPVTEDDQRLVRDVVNANDPVRHLPVGQPQVPAVESGRRADQA